MKYLNADELQAIHEVVIELSGGSQGIREHGLLISIIEKPQAMFSGQELYPNLFLKAAVIYEVIVNYHVFIDGNKRTGFAAMARFLSINGYDIDLNDKEIENYTVNIAVNNPDLADIAAWIESHSQASNK